ncbi:Tetratricopeptide TPR_1 repeat-containing protein [Isosphaera pallida ATCC 43644]|uniref:Tetratricopeptide TPR_1 repeat-containing protein n=1 Tax=Isosphaera pallida (strain ATCC 43644 / DSM 9630 / IS1B) TaxID=575540 RepID=E8R5D0_ISOPI|nr:tetratricopeptide repeat protein [Isosphaera pallida]ADV60671.1 Tetratricopeptide TPR_1 repeat-containing protein [Isosphaera pallida ATCC 43644]
MGSHVRTPSQCRLVGLAGLLSLTLAAGCQNVNGPKELANNAGRDGLETVQGSHSFTAKVTDQQAYNVHMDLGRVHELRGAHEAAIAEYLQALEVCERSPGRGLLHVAAGSNLNARKAKAHRRIASAYDRLGQFAQAETHYRLALQLTPNDHHIWNDAGYSYYLQNRWSDSERALRTAASMAPEDSRVQINLGLTLAASGKIDEAYNCLAKVAGPAVAHANLGYILAASGKRAEAREHYMAALRLQPEYTPFQRALRKLDEEIQTAGGGVTPKPSFLAVQPEPTAFWQDPKIARASAITGIPMPRPLDLTLKAN